MRCEGVECRVRSFYVDWMRLQGGTEVQARGLCSNKVHVVRVSDVGITPFRLHVRGSPWICVLYDTPLDAGTLSLSLRSRPIFSF